MEAVGRRAAPHAPVVLSCEFGFVMMSRDDMDGMDRIELGHRKFCTWRGRAPERMKFM